EVEKIIGSLAEVHNVAPETQEQVLEEAVGNAYRSGTTAAGGIAFAKRVLEEALGARKAADIINRIDVVMAKSTSFEVFHNINAAQLVNVLSKEQPQTIALVIAHLPPYQAAQIMAGLPEDTQNEVILRVAKMDKADPEVVAQIESVLRKQVSSYKQNLRTVGGARAVASILNLINRSTEKRILESLKEKEWEIAEEVKKLMFVFEDLVLVEDKSMQRVLKEIDIKDVTVALKAASDEVKAKFFSNLSKRAVEMIQEELEYMGPVKLKTVEEAQQKIVNIVRTLDEQGEVLIAGRGGREDEVLV
ncbi:MAG: flagellar motor switch protein FliG, partial [Verrucomicrobia bacterium]|nr:flagellar motor switch protein FliG [Verrucomicrobiota bacterium]